jgi:hypothetical protein
METTDTISASQIILMVLMLATPLLYLLALRVGKNDEDDDAT